MQQPLIHLWLGPVKTCVAFGYQQGNPLHKRITQAHEAEGWQRCVIVHHCYRFNKDIPAGVLLAISRIFDNYKYDVYHKV